MTIDGVSKDQKESVEQAINLCKSQIRFLIGELNKLEVGSPYLTKISFKREYNPNYGDDRICVCGDPYDRHFDTFDNMYPCGCKYCNCYDFEEQTENAKEK